MKKTITESQLRQIVKESVKRVLNEYMTRDDILYNEYGEIVDPGGWYDTDDYYDPYEDDRLNNTEAQRLAKRILNGDFDDKLYDDDWLSKVEDEYWNSDYDDDGGIYDAVKDRLKIIDKNYAMKFGRNTDNYNPDQVEREKAYPRDANLNTYDYKDGRKIAMGEKGYERPEIARDILKMRYPEVHNMIFKKNGEPRKASAITRISQKKYGNAADMRPLHRKGSANRDLMDMDKKKKQ